MPDDKKNKIPVSLRLDPLRYERLKTRAEKSGRSVGLEAEQILLQVLDDSRSAVLLLRMEKTQAAVSGLKKEIINATLLILATTTSPEEANRLVERAFPSEG